MFVLKERIVSKRGVAPLLGAMAIVVLLVFGGCGGGDDDSTTAGGSSDSGLTVETASLSAAEYKTQAEEICGQAFKKIEGDVQKAIRANAPLKTSVVVPPLEDMFDQLVNLGAPEGEEEQVEAFLVALEKDLEEAQDKPTATTGQLSLIFKQSGDLARKQGIIACGLGG
jgi:hypothetical protein